MKAVYLLSLFLLSLTNISIAQISGSGVLLTLFMLIGVPIAAYYYARAITSLPRLAFPGLWYSLCYVLAISLLYMQSSRWSSVLYTTYFIGVIGFFLGGRELISRDNFVSLAKLVMLAYFVNVVVSFGLYDVVGVPVLTSIFQVYDDGSRVRFQGFSSEPSYAAIIVNIACYAYTKTSSDSLRKKVVWFCLCVLQVVLFDSVYGYLLIVMNGYWLSTQTAWRTTVRITGLATAVIALAAISYVPFLWEQGESRISRLVLAVLSGGFNLDTFRAMDSSAFMRVGPIFGYISSSHYFSLGGIFGHGPGSSTSYFGWLFADAIGDKQMEGQGAVLNLGFVPGFLYDYGLVGALLVWFGIVKVATRKVFSNEMLLIAFVAFNANFNTQLFGYAVIMLYLTTRYEDSGKKLKPVHKAGEEIMWLR